MRPQILRGFFGVSFHVIFCHAHYLSFGGAVLAWVKSSRRARHGMPGQRHGPVQGKLHPASGAGIELSASLWHRLRQGRLLRHSERNVVESKDPVGEASPCLQPRRIAGDGCRICHCEPRIGAKQSHPRRLAGSSGHPLP